MTERGDNNEKRKKNFFRMVQRHCGNRGRFERYPQACRGLYLGKHHARRSGLSDQHVSSAVSDLCRGAEHQAGGFHFAHRRNVGRNNRPDNGYYQRPHPCKVRTPQEISANSGHPVHDSLYHEVDLIRNIGYRQHAQYYALVHRGNAALQHCVHHSERTAYFDAADGRAELLSANAVLIY